MSGAAIRVLRAADYRRTPWKNGGGATSEIAVSPEQAGLDAFDWRVSMAVVASDGPFSTFPGVDRTLTILQGSGLSLTIDGRAPCTLTPASPPLRFPADAPTTADLVEGPVVDLNVMSRRGRFTHTVTPFNLEGTLDIPVDGVAALVFCFAGSVTVTTAQMQARLGPLDALLARDATSERWRIEAGEPADVFLIAIRQG